MHVHGNDLTSFYEQVPKEVLPTEYGGEAGSIAENWGESSEVFIFYDHETPEIIHFYSSFILIHIANRPQNITNVE
jgi:hypothetical protein